MARFPKKALKRAISWLNVANLADRVVRVKSQVSNSGEGQVMLLQKLTRMAS
jgi:hypothetical protein